MEGSQEDTVEELDALKTKVAELESQLEQTRAEAQSQVQAAQADVASKDTVIASLQATVEQLRAQVTLGKRMGELRREFSSEEQQVVASMSDEQWTLFKRVGDAPVPPPFRQTMGGEEGAGASRVTLSRKV
jgi:phage-related tail protein